MDKREYGSKQEKISMIGFGGIIVMNEEQKDADAYVAEAIDLGVNYFDVAPSYGNAEEKLGPAIKGKRNGIFLACKTEKRTAEEARKALEESMKKLGTDHFDLYQLHGVTTMEDVETILGPGGCLEVFEKAKKDGLIKYIGFSAHSEDAAEALMDRYDFDSVLFPYNWVNVNVSGFGKRILQKASQKGVTRLALKAMAHTKWAEGEEKKYQKCWYKPVYDPQLAMMAVRFTLSRDITAAVTPGHMELFRTAVKAVENFKPLSPDEETYLKEKAKGLEPIF
jgi:predicted aldo/keto reductase-like oxidoreductase